jgi:hypothetical protein
MTEHLQVTVSGAGAVGIGGDNFGDIRTQVINQYAGRPEVTWPHRVGVVPPLAAGYQPRTNPAGDAAQVLTSEPADLAGSTLVLSGMGGIGKSQLAAADAHRAWDAGVMDLLVWVTASSRDAILTVYAQAGGDVTHPAAGETTEQVAGRFLTWLAITDKRWLVVLDNLTDPADLRGLWPQGKSGRVLVTTRRRDAALAARGQLVEVGLFSAEEALAYLIGRLDPHNQNPERLEQAAELAEDLGRLPLALAQAAAYILDRNLTCTAYRHRLAHHRLELILPDDASADDYALTVAATWSLSIELADRLPPTGLSRPLLLLAAQLSPDGIPTALFTTPAAREYLAARQGGGEQQGDSSVTALQEDVEDALQNLHRLSLITFIQDETDGGSSAVRVHGLVQRSTREQAALASAEQAASAAADALLQAWPVQDYLPQHGLLAQSLRDNTDALAHTTPAPLWVPQAHLVLFRAGRSRRDGGLLAQAVAY